MSETREEFSFGIWFNFDKSCDQDRLNEITR